MTSLQFLNLGQFVAGTGMLFCLAIIASALVKSRLQRTSAARADAASVYFPRSKSVRPAAPLTAEADSSRQCVDAVAG